MFKRIVLTWFFLVLTISLLAQRYLITDFGAKPNTDFINTEAINRAIETCNRNGGGVVIIPAGVFKSGTILMKDNVELHLDLGAILLASIEIEDFPIQPRTAYRSLLDEVGWRALIFAENVSNIAITGMGTIDGNGAKQKPVPALIAKGFRGGKDGRLRNIIFISCNNIRVTGIHMRNSGMWNQHYLDCEDVIIDRITVYNHSNRNNDGIDIDGCRRFVLSNSIFDTDDDAITLKSTGAAPTEDVTITNCIVSSHCNAIKCGTESTGGFKNITISNCIVKPSRHKGKPIYGYPEGITGISLEIVDGGTMQGVTISNVTIEGTACPLYVRLGNRARKHTPDAPEPQVGEMRNISISNLVAYGAGNFSSSITGIPGHAIENISLAQIQLYNKGGLQEGDYLAQIKDVKEDEKGYPQPNVWKNLPSSGLFIRHVDNIQISDLMLGSEKTDPRIPIVAEDVNGLRIENIGKIKNSGADAFFYGKDVKNIEIERPLGWEGEVFRLNYK